MKVTIISHTVSAAELLIFTKSTRLSLTPDLLNQIHKWPQEKINDELAYIANTIPSSWEFVDYVFLVENVSRAYTHQQVRTRAASYAQQSMRVIDMSKFGYVFTKKNLESEQAISTIKKVLDQIKFGYEKLLSLGQAEEDARGILPTNISTNIVCKFNLRTLTELVKSRSGGRTQNEYQQVVKAMADEVLKVHPWADKFLFPVDRDYFAEIEDFAQKEYAGNLKKKGELLKIVDKMRKELK